MKEDEIKRSKMPRIKQRKLKMLFFSLLIFICGMVVGGGIVTGFLGHFIHYGKYPERLTNHIVEKMEKKLELSEDQVVRMKAIFEKRNQSLIKIRKEVAPRVGAEIMTANREIQAILNEEQRVKWDAWFQKMKRRWIKRMPALVLPSKSPPSNTNRDDPVQPESQN